MNRAKLFLLNVFLVFALSAGNFFSPPKQSENPAPPDTLIRLIFIHHSTGENWLNDDNGGLARALQENNYFPSDTNYGWGPDGIGDRTDIPNWTEWFTGSNSQQIMQAVFSESEVNSPYNRTLQNPGGENQIIMFKSCFPNSALEGSPNDPPSPGADFSVGNAKYVYNQILQYFKSRPDKLFIVITAPPLTDGTHAANARAFNQWLVNDWLREYNYTLPNVGVFDFYNILTSPNNHHQFANGSIEHVINDNRNTEYYPSEDDHPSRQGNQKATAEFLPVLNVYYNRWQKSNPQPAQPQPVEAAPQPATAPETQPGSAVSLAGEMLFDFEDGQPVWEGSADEAVQSSIQCQPNSSAASSGAQSLRMEFNVLPESWTTCSHFFGGPQNFAAADGVQFMLSVERPGNILHMDVFTETNGERATYSHDIQYPAISGDWVPIQIPWNEFTRVEWETDGGSPFNHSDQVAGLAFGFPAGEEANNGIIRVDAIQLLTSGQSAPQTETSQSGEPQQPPVNEENNPQQSPPEEQKSRGIFPFCGSIALLPLGIILAGGIKRKHTLL